MNRTELLIVTAIILFVAFGLGWFAHWVVHRFTRISADQATELERMAHDLHEAEELRDQAVAFLDQREAELLAELRAARADLANLRTSMPLRDGATGENEALENAKKGVGGTDRNDPSDIKDMPGTGQK
ncbi:MAG: hypothetical protein NWQ69_05630 [Paracoccaceae bacterium]|jgi:prophage endopeptidase|nr:hypothetical protein [Paracoccaceae bacterium]